jgi:hypothetical protein
MRVVVSTIEEIDSDDGDIIAAFAPTSALGNRTDSGRSDSVSDMAPLKCRHFVWNCLIDRPFTEFPLKFLLLVDNGCHLVLIRLDVIKRLGLIIFYLKIPESIDIAIKDCKKKEMLLGTFVILRATSIDKQWHSKPVCAIIAPNLCMPIIFGLPFLLHNSIVTDHAAHSCIDKKSGYNLLNPIPVSPLPKELSPFEKIKSLKALKEDLVNELKVTCEPHRNLIEGTFEKVKEFDIMAAIKDRLESLALQETLHTEKKGFV